MKVESNEEEILVSCLIVLIFAFYVFIFWNIVVVSQNKEGLITKACFAGTIFLGILSLILWLSFGGKFSKDKIDYNIEFHPPKNLNSAKIGYMNSKSKLVDKKILISLILYLADKGYIKINGQFIEKSNIILEIEKKIEELKEQKKELIKKGKIKLALKIEDTIKMYAKNRKQFLNPTSHSKNEQITLIQKKKYDGNDSLEGVVQKELFKNGDFVRILEFKELNNIIDKANYLLKKMYKKTIYDERSIKSKFLNSIMSIVSVFLFLVGCLVKDLQVNEITNIIYIISFLSVLFVTFTNLIMLKRTEFSEKELNKITLFKECVLGLEKDAIKVLLRKYPSYYYEILPYAYVLGFSDEWIEKFEKIDSLNDYTGTYNLKTKKSFDNLIYSFIDDEY